MKKAQKWTNSYDSPDQAIPMYNANGLPAFCSIALSYGSHVLAFRVGYPSVEHRELEPFQNY